MTKDFKTNLIINSIWLLNKNVHKEKLKVSKQRHISLIPFENVLV